MSGFSFAVGNKKKTPFQVGQGRRQKGWKIAGQFAQLATCVAEAQGTRGREEASACDQAFQTKPEFLELAVVAAVSCCILLSCGAESRCGGR